MYHVKAVISQLESLSQVLSKSFEREHGSMASETQERWPERLRKTAADEQPPLWRVPSLLFLTENRSYKNRQHQGACFWLFAQGPWFSSRLVVWFLYGGEKTKELHQAKSSLKLLPQTR